MNRLSMSAPDLDEADVEAVVDVLRSGRLALGPRAAEFEREIAAYVGARHAVAVSSGTAALHVIVRALDIGEGDEVLVPSFTFAASVNAILYERATPVFVDVEPEHYTISPEDLESKITHRSRAILAVDIYGHPADWDAIRSVAARHRLRLVDDACEALGAEHRGVRLGSLGDATAFAFYPNKQITSGEGGMIVTDDADLAHLALSLRNQGRSAMSPWLRHERLGFNYRMDEMSAALGLSQLRRIEGLLDRRAAVAELYARRLGNLRGVRLPRVGPCMRMSWFVYVVTLDEGIDREAVMEAMQRRGVPTRAYFSPIHLQPYIRERPRGALPVTESAGRRTMALPFHGRMEAEDVERVARVLEEVLTRAGH